jgi:thiol-disulfide isomerase/thioredoxin
MRPRSLPPAVPIFLAVAGMLLAFALIQKQSGGPNDGSARQSPPLVAKTLDGKPFDLADRKGKLTLVNFWATWCGPCRREFPELIALQQKYADRGFTVVGVAQEPPDAETAVRAMAKDSGLNYPIVMITEPMVSDWAEVTGLPTSYLVDGQGRIVFKFEGVDPADPPAAKFGREIEARL